MSNDITEVVSVDQEIETVITLLIKEVSITREQILEVEYTQTSTGGTYVFTIQEGQSKSKITLHFYRDSQTIRIVDIQDFEIPMVVRPAPRPARPLTSAEIVNDPSFREVVYRVNQLPNIIRFTVD